MKDFPSCVVVRQAVCEHHACMCVWMENRYYHCQSTYHVLCDAFGEKYLASLFAASPSNHKSGDQSGSCDQY